jgi:PIN domain nuclease of toxin-antitoxin system
VRVLLDTVTFIRALQAPELLSKKAVAALHDADTICELSAISLSKIAIKYAIGKLNLDESAAREGIADLQLRVLSWRAEHAFRLFQMPRHHTDPFDRQLIAQALAENVPVVTSDQKFRLYSGIQIIW